MQLETKSDLLVEAPVQHLPTIRWFKNNWMDVVFETNSKGECVEFSISYREADDDFNIEWNGSQFFFSENNNNLEQTHNKAKEALFLLKNYGSEIPEELMDFLLTRLSSAIEI